MNDDIEPTPENIAAQLYAAYSAVLNHKDATGATMPMWQEFSDDPQNATLVKGFLAMGQKAIDLFTTP